ncbi:MAG TPA: DNA polymerase III subunit beta [Thermovirgaceae bacterium]|nr:DNA polymerase III subunit beta [Thermovirgaceae bacterium]
MKLLVDKAKFLKIWSMAERSAGHRSTISVLSGVKCEASAEGVALKATDLKTSINCLADGVEVLSEGSAIFPVKNIGEFFKKAPGDTFTIEVDKGKATVISGSSVYSFSTYPVSEFPKLPSSDKAEPFFKAVCMDLRRLLEEGTFSGSPSEEFPQYLSAGLVQTDEERVKVVSTDGRRLSLSQGTVTVDGEPDQVLLPLAGLRELQRSLSTVEGDEEIRVLKDDSQVYFRTGTMEFSVRRVESRFPPYEKVLSSDRTSWLTIDRELFIEALERVEVVVRDFSRMVVFMLSPGGTLKMQAKAPEVGEAFEEIPGDCDGEPLKIAFNVRYLLEGLKALHGTVAHLSFNGPNGQMTLSRPREDSFMYVLMPITLPEEENSEETA